ncbi:4-hydroxybenzoyl-CoA reductase subunit gamma [uncultured Roseburia sp.]|uniref:2Fe-2S iron-sulfur cluster-binding protein n=1 Tax=Brotonthovivens ammoniilytica TaxID=2981725 RepID=A0ABT2TGA9_9FIRM|nr:2Fe-2S iron-sulfur cluster-binding protein [Brotonthovivens ammoniilytica]MCU6761205.1 2Fe-2S iron-sulfur cluster-binding protein [Brotonthovivens ammoniilytica]SCI21867.1 4-hydroxybenzoyl-CoA reductase subunit gamma [uncultured Roseburia sp.]
MRLHVWINNKEYTDEIAPDQPLLEYLRSKGCYSVKRGCETSNCGLCTVWVDETPVLSCSVLAVRVQDKKIVTLEGLKKEAEEFAHFMAAQGADQCGYCNPGFVMNVLAMERELKQPGEEEIKEYLSGNLCRCTGYVSHLRAVKAYLNRKNII